MSADKLPSQLLPFKSEEEKHWYAVCEEVLNAIPEFGGARVVEITYEALSFDVAGGRYTPDFYVKLKFDNGTFLLVLVEVKGSKKQRGYRETKQKLNAAAALYPEFVFMEAFVTVRTRGGVRVGEVSKTSLVSRPPFRRISKPEEVERERINALFSGNGGSKEAMSDE